MRYVIIGNSAAGIFAAEAIRSNDPEASVDIITDEPWPAYARCLTSYYLEGKMTDDRLSIRPPDFYSRLNLNLRAGQKVVGMDPGQKKVMTDQGTEIQYDKLLVAAGATPVIPDIPGVETKGVFGLRTLADAKAIREFTGPGKKAVVVGGGLVSLKAAVALRKAGMTVDCVVSSGQILSQMLDRQAADLIGQVLQDNGVRIHFGADAAQIMPSDHAAKGRVVAGVGLSNGEELPADLVIIGKGVTPNTGFLRDSGIVVDRGIVVDDYLQTSLPDVYAAGDVAQGRDIVTGEKAVNALWPNAAEQGAAAGRNMTGKAVKYPGTIGMNSADFFGLAAISAGLSRAGEKDGLEVHASSPGPGQYRKLVFRDDILVGFILVGRVAKAGVLTACIKEKLPLGRAKAALIAGNYHPRYLWN